MKTYSINNLEKEYIQDDFNKYHKKLLTKYRKNPDRYIFENEKQADVQFKVLSVEFALFMQFKRDGLVRIEKHADTFYTFEDHAGDCFDPKVNSDIDQLELKRLEKNERKRASDQGFYYFILFVDDEEYDLIGGFIGNDFYGSGHDCDFYRKAIDIVKDIHESYYYQTLAALNNE